MVARGRRAWGMGASGRRRLLVVLLQARAIHTAAWWLVAAAGPAHHVDGTTHSNQSRSECSSITCGRSSSGFENLPPMI